MAARVADLAGDAAEVPRRALPLASCQPLPSPEQRQPLTSRCCGRRQRRCRHSGIVAAMSEPAYIGTVVRTRGALLTLQHGIATRQQLAAVGVSDAQLAAELAGRRWRRLNEHVIATHNGPLTRRQSMWAVVLSAPPPALLCSLTVYELYNIPGPDTDLVRVLVPRGARVLDVPGVRAKVHETRRFPAAEDIRWKDALPITSLARSAVDAAAWTRDVQAAWRVAVAPVQARLLRPETIRAELDSAGQVRHRRSLAMLLDDLDGGAQALSEVAFLRFCRRHHLPKPRCQVRLDTMGRRRYLDAEFRSRSGRIIRVEIDGGIHLKLAVRARDTIKDNDAHIDGQLVLRYASYSIYSDDPEALRQIRRALDS